MSVWPFFPRGEWQEALEFRTDAIRAFSTEQRLRLRDAPRRTFSHEYTWPDRIYERARALMRGNHPAPFEVPDFAQYEALPLTAGISVLPVDTSLASYTDRVIVIGDDYDYEVFDIASLESSNGGIEIDGTLANSYSRAIVAPLLSCDATDGLVATRTVQIAINASVEWRHNDGEDLAESESNETWDTYRGHPLLTHCARLGDGSFPESLQLPYTSVDNGLARPYIDTSQQRARQIFGTAWQPFTRSESWALRRFFYALRGRQRAFWAPVWSKGLQLAANVANGAGSLQIAHIGWSDHYEQTSEGAGDLFIKLRDGTSYALQIAAASSNGTVETLTLSEPAAADIATADVSAVTLLLFCRLGSDRIEFLHRAVVGPKVVTTLEQIPFFEGPC